MAQACERNRRTLRWNANRKMQANKYASMKVGMSSVGAEEPVVVMKLM